jgi:glycosyltransferase involved in cell wall biosynthesis
MTRILLTTDAVGGVWRYTIELAHSFAARGAEMVLAVLGPPPNAAQQLEAAAFRLCVTGLPLDWTADSPAELDAAAETLARLAWAVQADTVHLHSPALMGAAVWPVPVVVVAHSCVATWWKAVRGGPLPADLAWRERAVAAGLAAADTVIAPTASFANDLRDCYGLQRRITVIHNGRRPMTTRAERRPVALTAGRLWDEGKGLAILDAAAAALPYPVEAAGAMRGPHGASITLKYVHSLGSLSEVEMAQAYAQAAIFVSAGRYEPFGLAVLEAGQAGCALVLADIPTFRELWDGAAVFVPPGNPERLAEAVGRLLDDPSACTRAGLLARTCAARFSVERMAAATWAVHAGLLLREAA